MKALVTRTFLVLALVGMLFGYASANVTFIFDNITNNNATDAAIGEAQLFVEVSDAGGGFVLFTFGNIGSEDSSITDIYFDDDTGILVEIDDIDNSDPGVAYSEGSNPPDLPGRMGADPVFSVTPELSLDPDPPVQPNGINPGETLGVLLEISGSGSFDDVISDMTNGDLRIGIRVQGYESGGSESYVSIIPAPGAVLLGSIGAGLVGWLKRRRTL